jgi:hypothetical protein
MLVEPPEKSYDQKNFSKKKQNGRQKKKKKIENHRPRSSACLGPPAG